MKKEEPWTNSLETSGDPVHVLDYYIGTTCFCHHHAIFSRLGSSWRGSGKWGGGRAGENMRVIGKISSSTLIIFALVVHSRVALRQHQGIQGKISNGIEYTHMHAAVAAPHDSKDANKTKYTSNINTHNMRRPSTTSFRSRSSKSDINKNSSSIRTTIFKRVLLPGWLSHAKPCSFDWQ